MKHSSRSSKATLRLPPQMRQSGGGSVLRRKVPSRGTGLRTDFRGCAYCYLYYILFWGLNYFWIRLLNLSNKAGFDLKNITPRGEWVFSSFLPVKTLCYVCVSTGKLGPLYLPLTLPKTKNTSIFGKLTPHNGRIPKMRTPVFSALSCFQQGRENLGCGICLALFTLHGFSPTNRISRKSSRISEQPCLMLLLSFYLWFCLERS